jgi:capsular polysaccharide biosynthesis protein
MEFEQFLELISRKKQTIAIVTIVFVIFAVAFTFVQPLRYSAESKVLVMQALPEGVDPYQVSRSNEHVASLLTQVISTNSFYKEVINSGYNIDKAYFPESGNKQLKLWKKTVRAGSDPNGIISIKTYHNNRVQVNEIAEAVNFILETKHGLYHGFGNQVSVKIIEQPVTSDLPVKPNIFINMGVAFVFGILISITYVYLFPEKRYNLRLVPETSRPLASENIQSGRDEFEIRASAPVANPYPKSASQTAASPYTGPVRAPQHDVEYMENPLPKAAPRMQAIPNPREDQREIDKEIEIYEKIRSAMTPPPGIPFVDESEIGDENEIRFDPRIDSRPAPRDIERQGSMANILKQPGQRG